MGKSTALTNQLLAQKQRHAILQKKRAKFCIDSFAAAKVDALFVRRASIDGALCTVRCVISAGQIPNTKGEWLGIEWDDPNRGKHDGTHQGRRYFSCRSKLPTVASFVRPSRKFDPEKTVLEAIRYKYGGGDANDSGSPADVVVISGKVAEEIGFDKIAKEQGVLEDLKIVVLENLAIYGLAPRGSDSQAIKTAQLELATTCPNVVELDLSFNTIEYWRDICDICAALPKLRTLRLNGLRFCLPIGDLPLSSQEAFSQLKELHLNETLVNVEDVMQILGDSKSRYFPNLRKLWLSQNELETFSVTMSEVSAQYFSVEELMFENNLFPTVECLYPINSFFPNAKSISLQRNQIKTVSSGSSEGHTSPGPQPILVLESLSVSHNQITSFSFADQLATMLPNISSLRISDNPIYDTPQSDTSSTAASEINYYLTLARIETLKVLNYSQITSREREEGEIYYLARAEQHIKSLIATSDIGQPSAKKAILDDLRRIYPRYQPLCQKYDRESIISKISSQDSISQILEDHSKPKHPPGSIAAHLVESTFYVAQSVAPDEKVTPKPPSSLTWSIPGSISTSRIFAQVARWFDLPPLQFKLVYESNEFDPVRDDLTTKSQLDTGNHRSAEDRHRAWGDWDADGMVESSSPQASADNQAHEFVKGSSSFGKIVRNGKEWKRREAEILVGFRSWSDWLDSGVDVARIRVEPFCSPAQ